MKKLIVLLLLTIFSANLDIVKSQINNKGKLYLSKGNFAEAVNEFEKIMPKMEREHSVHYGETVFYLSIAYAQLRNYTKAEENFVKCINYCEKNRQTKAGYYINSLTELATIYQAQKRYGEAEELLLKAKNKLGKNTAQNNPIYIKIHTSLANLHKNNKEFDKAEVSYRKLCDLQKKNYGENSKEYMMSSINLGEFFYATKQYEKAIEVFRAINENMEMPEYALVCNDLGVLYTQTGEYDKAETYFIKSKELTANLLGTESPQYTNSCNQLAWFYHTTKKFDKSLSNLEENNKVKKEQVGEEHPDYAKSCMQLAEGYLSSKLYDKPIANLLLEAKSIYENSDSKTSDDYIRTCIDLGRFYTEMLVQEAQKKTPNNDSISKYYADAETILLDAKKLQTSNNAANSDIYILNIEWLLQLYTTKLDYDKMESLYLEMMAIIKSKSGTLNMEYAFNSYNLAVIYINKQMYDKAEPILTEAKQIGKIRFKKDVLYANICDALATVYDRTENDYQQAVLYEEIKKIQEKTLAANHPRYINTCVKLAQAYQKLGRNQEAERLYLYAIDAQKSDADKTSYLKSVRLLAKLYMSAKNYNQAVKLFTEFLNKSKTKDVVYASVCTDVAFINNKLGKYDEVENYYSKALKILDNEDLSKNSTAATIYNNLGVYYINTGNYEKANKLLLKSREIKANIYGKQSSEYATACGNLADIYSRKGKVEQAVKLYEEVLTIYEATIGKFNSKYASALNNVALLYHKRSNLPKAVAFSKEAMDISKKRYGKNSEEYISTCSNLAGLYAEWAKNDSAEYYYVEADSINRIVRSVKHPDFAFVPHSLACFYDKIGEHDKAAPLYIQTNEMFISLLQQSEKYMSEKEREIYISRKINSFFNINHSFFINRQQNNDSLIGIVYNNALNVKEQLLKSSVAMRKSILQSKDSTLVRKYEEMIKYRKILSKEYSLPIAKHSKNIQELEEKVNSLEKELLRSTNRGGKSVNMSWQAIRDTLQDDQAAIEFIQYTYHNGFKLTDTVYYYALVLRKDYDFPKAVFLCDQSQLQSIFKREEGMEEYGYITSLYDAQSLKAKMLYQYAWRPLEQYLNGVSNVYISPAGLLNNVAFDAIPYKKRDLLSDKYKITYLTSTSKLLSPTSLYAENANNLALFGGIEYDMSIDEMQYRSENFKAGNTEDIETNFDDDLFSSGPWSYLPGSLKEVEAIKQSLGDKNIDISLYKGKQGSEEQFKALENNAPYILHVATHGFYFGSQDKQDMVSQNVKFAHSDNPMVRSGFILAGGNNAFEGKNLPQGVEDGVLTASEISNLNLFNTKLVVLSACQTGQGDVKGNEGVYGLQRSFKMSGANFLLFSLWEIPDEPTKELMSNFYKYWFSGLEIREAFKKAQNKLKAKFKKVKGAAYAWAAFVLVE